MSDNRRSLLASQRISIRIPESLGQRLRKQSVMKGQSESEVVRAALETYFARTGSEFSAYELAEETGLIGCLRRGPKDLSSNRRHFKGFGTSQ